MPLELHIENANLSESYYASLFITGVAQHSLGIRGRQFSGDGQSGQRYLVVVASRLLIRAEIRPSLSYETVSSPKLQNNRGQSD